MFNVIAFALLAQVPAGPEAKSPVGLPPVLGVASVDAKGMLTIARISTSPAGHGVNGVGDRDLWIKAADKKPGEKVLVKAKVTQMTVTVIEAPAKVIEAFTADGKAISTAKLAELLAKERTVLIALAGKKPDPFHMQLYKEDAILLVPPDNLLQPDFGPYAIPNNQPLQPPAEVRPFDKGGPKPDKEKAIEPPDAGAKSQDGVKEKPSASESPAARGIGGMLRLRNKLPHTPAPIATMAVANLGNITLTRQVIEHTPVRTRRVENVVEQVPMAVAVNVNGKIEQRVVYRAVTRQVEREVTVYQSTLRPVNQNVPPEAVNAFAVTKSGTLEAIPKTALLEKLAAPTQTLIGEAEVDPRHLELIRPGTLYLAIPPAGNLPIAPPMRPSKNGD